ncbi:MAG: MFS transporter [Xanthomonadales bacterium]|nr:MFS transporter [Xanthomonadales bacterium]
MNSTQVIYPKPSVAWFAVLVLMLAYTFSFIDRLILSLLVEPIKLDLGLSDVKISLLQGLSFAVFYTLAGIPVGRFVDSSKRTNIISIGILLWCLMTAACGLAQRFWQLFLARAGVGVGEAALAPAAYSMISDLFPPQSRGVALGIFSCGTAFGAGLALIIGGYAIQVISASGPQTLPFFGELEPWRLTFIYVGLPGVLVALLIKFVPEPERHLTAVEAAAGSRQSIPMREVLTHYRQHGRTIGYHHAGQALAAMGSYGIMAWAPVMLMRTQGWSINEVGNAIGGTILVVGTFAVIAGGWLGDKLEKMGRPAGRMEAAAISMVIGMVGAFLYPLANSAVLIVCLFAVMVLGGWMVIATSAAALMDIMPNRMRGQATAIYFFVISLLGIGTGPTLVAMLTDYVFGNPEDVRWALMIAPPTAYALSALCFWRCRLHFIKSVEFIRDGHPST